MSLRKERNVVIEWGAVKQQMLHLIEHGEWKGGGPNKKHHTAADWVQRATYRNPITGEIEGLAQKSSWEGGSLLDTAKNLRDGYRAKEFRHSAEYVPMGEERTQEWNDEPDGDLDLGRLYGGYDDYYLSPADDEKKPGIRVMVEMAFAAGMSNKAIRDYGAWVAGLLASLESSGYDITVDIWVRLDNLFNDGMRDNVLIRVKRENEVSDFTEWSALFGPTGYRHVVFCAKMVAGDKIGRQCYSGLGHTLISEWKLDYDKENSTLRIMVDQRGSSAPIESLNAQAVKLGLLPDAQKI